MDLDTRSLLEGQVALLEAGDAAGLARRYHPDAQILHRDGVVSGAGAIEELFTEVCAGRPRVVSATTVARTDDTLLYDVVEDVGGEVLRIVGTFVLRDGLIWRHVSLDVPVEG